MTTSDADALIRRIAVATATSEGFGPDQPDHEDVVGEYMSDSTFLAPAIAEEVRAASEKAFSEGKRAMRDSLATQEPTEAEVHAAWIEWISHDERGLEEMRSALSAARSVRRGEEECNG